MPRFLDTTGNPTLGIGICSRCSRKFPLHLLQPDPNFPGLRVCEKDKDQYDPYRLPARPPDKISLPFTRLDAPIPTNPSGVIGEGEQVFLVTEDFTGYLIFFEDGEL